jgi:uncharacterized SAM-binding protein YcdF (DUF218 family)
LEILIVPNKRIKYQQCLANTTILLPSIKLLYAIYNTQPKEPAVGVCLQGDTTLRLETTLELYNSGKIQNIIVSGGGEENINRDERPANLMKDFLVSHGLPEKVIYLERKAKTTHEHPKYVNEIMHENGFSNLLLITSGYHLLRAYLRFLDIIFHEEISYKLYGYPAGSSKSWIQKTPTGKMHRFLYYFCVELTKISTYSGLASFDDAWKYIRKLKK